MMSIRCKILFCGRHLSSITVRLTQKYFDNNLWLIISITSDSYLTYSILLDKFSSKVCTYCYHIINLCNNISNAFNLRFIYINMYVFVQQIQKSFQCSTNDIYTEHCMVCIIIEISDLHFRHLLRHLRRKSYDKVLKCLISKPI